MLWLVVNNLSFSTYIDWESIIRWQSTLQEQLSTKKTDTTKQNIPQTLNKWQLNLITTFNKGFIDKYNQDLKKIQETQRIIEKIKELDKQQQEQEFLKYWQMIQLFTNIENTIDKADYVLLFKYNINSINYFDYKWQKFIFYLKPIIFENLSRNPKYKWIEDKLKKDLEALLQINDLKQLKDTIDKIKQKYLLKDFYQIIPISKLNNYFKFKLWRWNQTLFDIQIPNLQYYNSLYYIPNTVNKYIDKNYIYFYFPVGKQDLENIIDSKIDSIDFNKFYCLELKYTDSFYYIDKWACNFLQNSKYNKIIELDMSSSEVLKQINLKVVDRWNEVIDIVVILSGILFALLLFYFLKYLKIKRHQHEQDAL